MYTALVSNENKPIWDQPLPKNSKQNLQTYLSTKGEDKNLLKHVSNVMAHCVEHCPDQALEKFEEVSYLLKKDQPKIRKAPALPEDFLQINLKKPYAQPSDVSMKDSTHINLQSCQQYFPKKVEKKVTEEGDEIPAETAPPIGNIPDLNEASKVWQWAGVDFGEQTLYLLQKSLQQLLKTSGASNMKLWGKIRGTNKDYFIAEGVLEKAEGEEGADASVDIAEPRGAPGINKMVYWACNSPTEQWTLLPDLSPQDILNARAMKFSFSGDLNARIFTNPFYFQQERYYLRAQIARITHSTQIAPKGNYRFVEETQEREIEENNPEEGELKKPSASQMTDLSMWVHLHPSILQQGRLKHKAPKAPEGEEEVDEEELMRREVARDPWEPRLKLITKDAQSVGSLPAWTLRQYQIDQVTKDERKGYRENGIVIVKSQWWPGSLSMYWQEKQYFIYVGDGLKHEEHSYYPVSPPVMQQDRKEKTVYDEPNPTQAWLNKKAEIDAKQVDQPVVEE